MPKLPRFSLPKSVAVIAVFCTGLLTVDPSPIVFDAGLGPQYVPDLPALQYATAAVLLDFETGDILYSDQGDLPWPPASLTKLVTIYTALEAVGTGAFDLATPQPVHPQAYASAMEPGSSLMFLGPDQIVSGADLFRGLLISSGNDAATEVALRVSGSISQFARRMNHAVMRLGCESCYFEEPAGLSAGNRITAESFAVFVRTLLQRWPEILTDYASLSTYTYPEARHFVGGTVAGRSITQANRNTLIGSYDGADGLKTGFIEESGYNLVATAERGGRRLIAVILGVEGESHAIGGARRGDDARTLLDWGFGSYRRIAFPPPVVNEIRIWGGAVDSTQPTVTPIDDATVPERAVGSVERTTEVVEELWAPIKEATVIGTVRYHVGSQVIGEMPIIVAESIPPGHVAKRFRDWIVSKFAD